MEKMTTPASFNFYDGMALAVNELDELTETLGLAPDEIEEAKKEFVWDIVQYGCWLVEPDFSKYDISLRTAIRMAFGVMRYSIDKSRKSIASGKKGGRPKKKKEPDQVPASHEDYSDDRGWDSVSIARELA